MIAVAKVICRDILDALDLLLNPLRLKSTLRDYTTFRHENAIQRR